jgi:hypothetical protein
VDAVRAGRQRHIDAVTDEDSDPRTARDGHAALHQPQQRPAIETGLTDLNQVNAAVDGPRDLLEQRWLAKLVA